MLFLSKKKFIFTLVCNIVYAGQLFMTKSDITQRTPAPTYNVVAVSVDHASLQQGGQLARPHRLTTPRPVHMSVPLQMLRLSLPSVFRSLVYINTLGRTYMHELFIEYVQVTTWVARFSSNKLEANYHVLSAAVCTRWLNGQVHKSLPLQFG